jgi:hypothetical protein
MRAILEDLFGLASNGGGTSGVTQPKVTAYQWGLFQNAPNPAVASTEIRYAVARGTDVKIQVYSATGQLVRVLVDARKEPGQYSTSWDCRDSRGRQVSSGVYFCKMEASGYRATRKMVIAK